ncbi:PfkB family carbohydrate kinase [Luteolibacter sp. GHJ8]|uniref:PfkB family carbohydrate kinase n=1 Tax=Luteolibacter rhizosphaerae TaxID=2989719 RepID=A0ABT3FXC9_9BACT|nr:PfkB family carbohydrate kinase [Luteolibacter rhizosphaerae]MCW1912247.1 PfkB family carbohydrate kinase [Luteolibacter rhizosphaerae]
MKPLVIGLGEVLWDVLPSGPRMGGAPANFACHARALGAEAAVISSVGRDEDGERLLELLAELGLSTEGISTDVERATGSVTVELGTDGQPCYTIREGVAWDHIVATEAALAQAAAASAICFGSLGQRSLVSQQSIRRLVEATPASALRIFDVNLRQGFYSSEVIHDSLVMANVLKLSDSELPVLAELLNLQGSLREQIETLRSHYDLKLVVYTRGGNGSILWDGVTWCEHSGLPAEVKDTVGAGDSFTAATTMGFLLGWPLGAISENANAVAAHVCSCVGAIPPIPEALRQRFTKDAFSGKAVTEPAMRLTGLSQSRA